MYLNVVVTESNKETVEFFYLGKELRAMGVMKSKELPVGYILA
jgi:hypothetical protein